MSSAGESGFAAFDSGLEEFVKVTALEEHGGPVVGGRRRVRGLVGFLPDGLKNDVLGGGGRRILIGFVVGRARRRDDQLAGAIRTFDNGAGLPLGDAKQLVAVHAAKSDGHGSAPGGLTIISV
jgi:hypothetical protein